MQRVIHWNNRAVFNNHLVFEQTWGHATVKLTSLLKLPEMSKSSYWFYLLVIISAVNDVACTSLTTRSRETLSASAAVARATRFLACSSVQTRTRSAGKFCHQVIILTSWSIFKIMKITIVTKNEQKKLHTHTGFTARSREIFSACTAKARATGFLACSSVQTRTRGAGKLCH